MRYVFIVFFALLAIVLAVAGFRGGLSRRPPIELFADMVRQAKQRPQFENDFFGDGRGSRFRPEGTVARGEAFEETPLNTGRIAGTTNFIEVLPVPVSRELLARGRERFGISCLPCHGAQGDGNGITRKIGAMGVVANLHEPRIVTMPDGELFNTISNGKNLMGAYAANVSRTDRWAIIAYLRALQLSKLGSLDDVPAELRSQIK